MVGFGRANDLRWGQQGRTLVTLLLNAGMTVSAFGDPDQTMFEFQGADPPLPH